VLVWGNRKWQMPYWYKNLMSEEERASFQRYFPNEPNRWASKDVISKEWTYMSFDESAAAFSTFVKNLDTALENRIKQIAEHYKGRLHSYDVVNESAEDMKNDLIPENHPASKSRYGIMNGDYPYKSLKWAEKYFPSDVALNINDYFKTPTYTEQTNRLLERGCKIDVMGLQMHLFDLKLCQGIADGWKVQTPSQVRQYIGYANQTGLPLHLSEITITAPSQDERGLMIQGIITQQLYRLWFSQEKMIGITWWNVVDGCGAKKEPTVSGLFTRDMQPKPSYYALDQLINHEWKTNITVKADENGKVKFRGFRGTYRITYKDKRGKTQTMEYELK
ncbi:MAG: endo-1,4-beta-xylanase, partial [Alistipes sp.]|nr:endo-1,4-beta-xylanase [Alistipes sp.]